MYEAGEQSRQNNPNIAVLAYSFSHVVRKWVTLVGDPQYTDYFRGVRVWGNDLYVLTTSYS